MKGKLHFIGITFVVALATISMTDSKLILGETAVEDKPSQLKICRWGGYWFIAVIVGTIERSVRDSSCLLNL